MTSRVLMGLGGGYLVALLVLPAVAFAQDTGFVPLTNVPFLTETGNAFSLDSFLNGLYRLCIGIAAVVAVLQIMRAGIMYMGGDSVTEKKEAKNLIALSIGGLILVLSPVVVFSLINPEILSLKIGNIDQLKVESRSTCTPACTGGAACVGGTCITPTNGVGDGSCSVQCTAGNECRNGQCVQASSGSCPTFTNGQTVPPAQQNCCAAQQGCELKVRSAPGTELGIESFCSCQEPEPQPPLPGDQEGGPFTFRFFVAYRELKPDGTRADACMLTIEKTDPSVSSCVSSYNQWLIDFASDRATYVHFATGKGCQTDVYEVPYLKANWDRISPLPRCQ